MPFYVEKPGMLGGFKFAPFVIEAVEAGNYLQVVGPKDFQRRWSLVKQTSFVEVEGPARRITESERSFLLEGRLTSS